MTGKMYASRTKYTLLKRICLCACLSLYFLFIVGCASTKNTNQQDTVSQNIDNTTQTNQSIEKSKQHIVALGDSLTAGYGLSQSESYPVQLEKILRDRGYDVLIRNGGNSGDTTAQLLARLAWSLGDLEPGALVLLVIGANDGMQGLSLDQMEDNISAIIAYVQASGHDVVLGGMQIPTNLGEDYRQGFADIYPRLADTFSIPLIPFFLEGVAARPDLNLPDGIHPTKEGYAIIANAVADFLISNQILRD